MNILDSICPACRVSCGLGAPREVPVSTLCEAHREHVERHAAPHQYEPVTWRKIGDPWPDDGKTVEMRA